MIYCAALGFALLVWVLHDWLPLIGGAALLGVGVIIGVRV